MIDSIKLILISLNDEYKKIITLMITTDTIVRYIRCNLPEFTV